jgi:hypothetical protein
MRNIAESFSNPSISAGLHRILAEVSFPLGKDLLTVLIPPLVSRERNHSRIFLSGKQYMFLGIKPLHAEGM